MKRLTIINGAPVVVTLVTSNARDLAVRRLRRADPTDDRPAQVHAWAAGYGSAWGDTIEEACDALATLARMAHAAHAHAADPAARPGWRSPAERAVVIARLARRAVTPAARAFLRDAAADLAGLAA